MIISLRVKGAYFQVAEASCLISALWAPLEGLESRLITQRGRGQLSGERRKSSSGVLEAIEFLIRESAPNGAIPSISRKRVVGVVKAELSLPDSFLRLCFCLLNKWSWKSTCTAQQQKVSRKCARKEKSSRKSEASSDSVIYHQSDCCLAGSGWLGAWTSWKGAGRKWRQHSSYLKLHPLKGVFADCAGAGAEKRARRLCPGTDAERQNDSSAGFMVLK